MSGLRLQARPDIPEPLPPPDVPSSIFQIFSFFFAGFLFAIPSNAHILS